MGGTVGPVDARPIPPFMDARILFAFILSAVPRWEVDLLRLCVLLFLDQPISGSF